MPEQRASGEGGQGKRGGGQGHWEGGGGEGEGECKENWGIWREILWEIWG